MIDLDEIEKAAKAATPGCDYRVFEQLIEVGYRRDTILALIDIVKCAALLAETEFYGLSDWQAKGIAALRMKIKMLEDLDEQQANN